MTEPTEAGRKPVAPAVPPGNVKTSRRPYRAPSLVELGRFRDLTLSGFGEIGDAENFFVDGVPIDHDDLPS